MQKRIAAVVIALVGVVLIGSTLYNNLFSVGPAFEELTDDFRPVMTDEAIATARADIAMLVAVDEEFSTTVIPTIAGALGMTPQEFQAFAGENFPDVMAGVQALPQIGTQFNGLIDTLAAQQANFTSADAIPTQNLPATTIPWGLMLAGLVFLGLGIWLYVMPRSAIAYGAFGFGAVIVMAVLAMSLIPKAGDADDMNAGLTPVYTEATVSGAEQALVLMSAMGTEMQTEMLPALAQQLGMQPDQLEGFLGSAFPATASALQELPNALGRFDDLAGRFRANLENWDTMQPVAFSPIIFTLVIGAAVALIAASGYGLLQRQEVPVPAEAAFADGGVEVSTHGADVKTSEEKPTITT